MAAVEANAKAKQQQTEVGKAAGTSKAKASKSVKTKGNNDSDKSTTPQQAVAARCSCSNPSSSTGAATAIAAPQELPSRQTGEDDFSTGPGYGNGFFPLPKAEDWRASPSRLTANCLSAGPSAATSFSSSGTDQEGKRHEEDHNFEPVYHPNAASSDGRHREWRRTGKSMVLFIGGINTEEGRASRERSSGDSSENLHCRRDPDACAGTNSVSRPIGQSACEYRACLDGRPLEAARGLPDSTEVGGDRKTAGCHDLGAPIEPAMRALTQDAPAVLSNTQTPKPTRRLNQKNRASEAIAQRTEKEIAKEKENCAEGETCEQTDQQQRPQ